MRLCCFPWQVRPYKLDSLRVLGTVGEPINPEAWRWLHDEVRLSLSLSLSTCIHFFF
jgi:acyl-coenzyme A synthetase/AMP-(fatty) acid ligase